MAWPERTIPVASKCRLRRCICRLSWLTPMTMRLIFRANTTAKPALRVWASPESVVASFEDATSVPSRKPHLPFDAAGFGELFQAWSLNFVASTIRGLNTRDKDMESRSKGNILSALRMNMTAADLPNGSNRLLHLVIALGYSRNGQTASAQQAIHRQRGQM